MSRLGTLSNCRGEAKEVATKQEKMRNIILVDVRRDCVSGRSVEEIKYSVLSRGLPFHAQIQTTCLPCIGVVNRDSSTVGPEKWEKSLFNIPFW